MSKVRAVSAKRIAIGVLVALSSACGGKVDETPVKREPANCYSMCVLMAQANCGGDEVSSCTANCKLMPAGNCRAQLQAALDCAWWDAEYSCVDGGDRAVMYGCDAPWAAYLACAGGQSDGGT